MRSILLISAALLAAPAFAQPALQSADDWPYFARTTMSDRFAPQTEITSANVAGLKEHCRYDLGRQTSFQTGPIVVNGTLFLTTDFDTVALDPDTCAVKWRTTETYKPAGALEVNRGAAYLDGRIFRGTQDGRVLAYDASSGKRIWEMTIADPAKGETVPAALLAWDNMVFAGNAGGDSKGVKGRMYALDAKTGKIIWEQYLVPRDATDVGRGPAAPSPDLRGAWKNAANVPITGGATWTSYSLDPGKGLLYVPGGNPAPDFAAHLRPGDNRYAGSIVVLDARTGAVASHYPLVLRDFHDWDVSAAPALFTSRAGRLSLAAAIKDGYLTVVDRSSGVRRFRVPVTTITNAAKSFSQAKATRFCPGSQGGTEWNGPGYSPNTNLIYTGAVDWCVSVTLQSDDEINAVAPGQPWSGNKGGPKAAFGNFDPPGRWAGWLYATDADTGRVVWRVKTKAPILGGVTPTAGGLLFAGDMGGAFAAYDANSGARLWSTETGGAIGGGVISYAIGGKQRIAVASGMVSAIWPTPKVNATLIVYGLGD